MLRQINRMKGGVDMEKKMRLAKKEWAIILGLVLVVAVVAGAVSAGITGNSIKIRDIRGLGYKVYTQGEIDRMFEKKFACFNDETIKLQVGGEGANPFEYVRLGDNVFSVELIHATDTSATIRFTEFADDDEPVVININEGSSKMITSYEIFVLSADEDIARGNIVATINLKNTC